MALSVDTNILVYALNQDSDVHESARGFLESVAPRTDVVIAEPALVELYLLIRNPNWRIVECRPVMERVWDAAGEPDFATRNTVYFADLGFERVFDPLGTATTA